MQPTKIPTLADKALIQALAEALLSEAEKLGVVVTIERQPCAPLAMGNHHPVICVWPHRKEPQA